MKAPTILLGAGVIAAASLLLVMDRRGAVSSDADQTELGVRDGNPPMAADHSDEQALPLNGGIRSAVESEPAEGEPAATSEEVEAAPVVITLEEIELIRENLDGVYANASRTQLIEGYRNSYAAMPRDLIPALHKGLLEEGRYEVLDHPITTKGETWVAPNVEASPLAHGLVQVNLLEDGRSVRTELDINELGQHAALAVELGWFELAIERAARKEKAELRK